MANDNLKAKLAEYEAAYAKNCEKVPARQNLPEQPVYTPLDLEAFQSIWRWGQCCTRAICYFTCID